MTAAAKSTLVLNADYRPMATWPLSLIDARDAVSAVWRDRVNVVEDWPGLFFRSPSVTIAVPKTIALREYAHIRGEPECVRRSILLRDRYRCQYCGARFVSEDLTFDHVVPRSKGGVTEWTNVVMACVKCNSDKADRSDMKPLVKPYQPTNMELLVAGLEFLPNDIRESWPEFLYWNGALKE